MSNVDKDVNTKAIFAVMNTTLAVVKTKPEKKIKAQKIKAGI